MLDDLERSKCCLQSAASSQVKYCDKAMQAGFLPFFICRVQVRGHLERNGERVAGPALFGRWDEAMYVELPGGQQRLLWQKNPPPAEPTRCAHM